MQCLKLLGITTFLLVISSYTSAAVIWDESINGDLATDPSVPTPVTLNIGSNTISGSVSAPNDIRDYITFIIAPGQSLTAISLLSYEDATTGGPGNLGFHAINSGSTSFIPGVATAGNFLGGNHLASAPAGTDLLPDLANAILAGTGFSTPLGPGTYSYLIQQTAPALTNYSIDLTIVPIPAAVWLLGSILMPLLAFASWKK